MDNVTEVRGYMVVSCLKYLDEHYSAEDRKRYLEALPAALREKLPHIDKVAWYPKSDVATLFGAFVTLHKDDEQGAYAALEGVGRTVGEDATTTYMRLLLRFLTVRLFWAKIQSFWSRDHRGGHLSVDKLDEERRVVVVRHAGIAGYDYIAGIGTGFLKVGVGCLGQKNVRAKVEGFSLANPGPEEVRYTITWD